MHCSPENLYVRVIHRASQNYQNYSINLDGNSSHADFMGFSFVEKYSVGLLAEEKLKPRLPWDFLRFICPSCSIDRVCLRFVEVELTSKLLKLDRIYITLKKAVEIIKI